MHDLTTIQSFLKVEQIIFEIIDLVLNNEMKWKWIQHTFLSGFPAFWWYTNKPARGSWCDWRLVKKVWFILFKILFAVRCSLLAVLLLMLSLLPSSISTKKRFCCAVTRNEGWLVLKQDFWANLCNKHLCSSHFAIVPLTVVAIKVIDGSEHYTDRKVFS